MSSDYQRLSFRVTKTLAQELERRRVQWSLTDRGQVLEHLLSWMVSDDPPVDPDDWMNEPPPGPPAWGDGPYPPPSL